MNRPVAKIFAPLDPHWDRIVRRPMPDVEIYALDKLVGLPVPADFRDYLRHVGLFQDLTNWDVSPIEVFETPSEFATAREFLTVTLVPAQPDLFPFGGDGAGNLFCLPPDSGKACTIHFVDHETGKITRQKAFSAWLESVVKKVLKNIRTRPLNERKVWCVQFSFSKTTLPELLDLLRSIGEVEVLDPDWTNLDTSPVGVISSNRLIKLNGMNIKLGQLEYVEWEAPMLSFNVCEPVLKHAVGSDIRALDALFKMNRPDYKLVDYGPLDSAAAGLGYDS